MRIAVIELPGRRVRKWAAWFEEELGTASGPVVVASSKVAAIMQASQANDWQRNHPAEVEA